MSQIRVTNVTFGYEGSFDNVFEKVSFVLDTDWKLGFIGRNGKGKTTFLRLLQGMYPYQGSIASDVVFTYFPYSLTAQQKKLCAAEFIEEVREGCEVWQVICELEKLHLDADILYRPFEQLSFGEQTKVMLAILFSGERHFLLIDEPTNHLDEEARVVVKEYLQKKKGFILVSHDREFLNECVDHILALNRSTITVEQGNFDSWWENKQRKDSFEQKENEKHKKEIKKLREAARRAENWAVKNESTKIGYDPVKEPDRCISTRAYIGAKTKKMQSRVKTMEQRMQREIEEKEELLKDIERMADLKIMPMSHYKDTYIRAKEYSVLFGKVQALKKLTLELHQGDRIWLRGPNGSGKSTFIQAVLDYAKKAGREGCTETGTLEVAGNLVISYVSQDTSGLKGSLSEFARQRGLPESRLLAILRQLDFERS